MNMIELISPPESAVLATSPPDHLSEQARVWWRSIVAEYGIDETVGLLLLTCAAQAWDRSDSARAQIEKEGATILDRFGQLKNHPAIMVERDSRAQFITALKSLNLDLEPLRDGPGRPPRRA